VAAAAVERIVVQATAQDKRAIAAKAKKLELPVSELMRRGAFAYQAAEADAELAALADAAKGAADRAGAAIDDALLFIDASNKRIAAMEAKAANKVARAAPARRPA
jgi:hypothetical protein